MFQQFMGTVKDLYDNVDGFFDDLIGEDSLTDIVKTVGSSLGEGLETVTKKGVSTSTSESPMLDFDTESTDGLEDFLKSQEQNSQAIKSADPTSIEREWLERFRAIAKGQVLGGQE